MYRKLKPKIIALRACEQKTKPKQASAHKYPDAHQKFLLTFKLRVVWISMLPLLLFFLKESVEMGTFLYTQGPEVNSNT